MLICDICGKYESIESIQTKKDGTVISICTECKEQLDIFQKSNIPSDLLWAQQYIQRQISQTNSSDAKSYLIRVYNFCINDVDIIVNKSIDPNGNENASNPISKDVIPDNPTTKPTESSSNGCAGCFIAILVLIVIAYFVNSTMHTSSYTIGGGSNASSYSANDRSADAWVCAQDIVTSYLKSPSTAQFCSIIEATITDMGSNKYKIVGYVDAENSFGAKLRKEFIVSLTLTGEGYKNGTCTFSE